MIEQQTQQSVRVVVADGSELLRRGIRDVLTKDRRYRFAVVGDLARPADVPASVRQLAPDVVFLSMSARDQGARVFRDLLAIDRDACVIALVDETDVHTMLDAIRAGARGVLVRDAPATTLLEAAHDVIEGGAALDPRLSAVLFAHLASPEQTNGTGGRGLDPAALTPLSPREREVLHALAHGYRNKEIAVALGVSVGTVKTHLRHIFRKMKVADRTSAVLLALRVRPEAAA